VFDTLGLNSLRALTAPMLIDSYPLQRAVIASDIPGEMLADLDDVDVTGIAVLADGLRKPIAVDQPLMSPDDYADIRFTALRSRTHADSIRALGAIPGEALAASRNRSPSSRTGSFSTVTMTAGGRPARSGSCSGDRSGSSRGTAGA
jgi:TRAP-type transport system periplasmic protein